MKCVGNWGYKWVFLTMAFCLLVQPAMFAQTAPSVVCTIDMHKVLEAYMKIPGITGNVSSAMGKSLESAAFTASQTGKALASGEAELAAKEKNEKVVAKKEPADVQRANAINAQRNNLFQEKQQAMSDFGGQVLRDIRSAVTTVMQKNGAQVLINTSTKNKQDFFQTYNGSMNAFTENLYQQKFPKGVKGMENMVGSGTPSPWRALPGMTSPGAGGPPQMAGMSSGGPGAGGMAPPMGGMSGMGQGGFPGGMPGGAGGMPPRQALGMGAGGPPGMGQGAGAGMPGGMGVSNDSQFMELMNWLTQPVPVSQGKDITEEVVELLTQSKR